MSNLAEITFSGSLQAHQAAWFVMKRSITSVDRHDQFESLKSYSYVRRQLCRHIRAHIHLLYYCAGNNISHSDDTLHL